MFGLKPQIQYLLLLVVVGLLLFSCSVQSMRFDLPSNLAKCFAQELKKGSVTIGNYTLVNSNDGHPLPPSHNFTVEVKLQGKDTVLHSGEQVQSGQFSLTAYRDGDYLVCFWGGDHFSPPITFSIDFDWKTGVAVDPNHWPRVAKKSNIDKMVYDLFVMHDTILSIHEEMAYLREQDYEMQVFNRKTTAGMLLMSMVSFCVCFSVAGVQLLYLKNYFQKNKIL